MRLIALFTVLLLVSCSKTGTNQPEPAKKTNPADEAHKQVQSQPHQEEEPQKTPPAVNQPTYANLEFDDPVLFQNDPSDPDPADPPVMEDPDVAPTGDRLDEYLNSLYGVRLPLSTSWLPLESEIGRPPYVSPLNTEPIPGAQNFVREFIITTNRNEVFVNKLKVADLDCTTSSGEPCKDSYDDVDVRRHHTIRIPDRAGSANEFIISTLLDQLQYFQKIRHAVLRTLSNEALQWSLNCDIYTIAIDRDVTFGVLARIIHTAGFSDLTRIRLAVRDENETLNYIPIHSPRFDSKQKQRFHIVGDNWWEADDREGTGFEPCYLAYTASVKPEDFMSFYPQSLPVCLPTDIIWSNILDEDMSRRDAASRLQEHIDNIRETHEALLSLTQPVDAPIPEKSAPMMADSTRQKLTPELPKKDTAKAAAILPNNNPKKVVGTVGGDGDPEALDAKVANNVDGALSNPEQLDAKLPSRLPTGTSDEELELLDEEVVPFLFISHDHLRLALRQPSGEVMEVVEFSSRDLPKLYPYLTRMRGKIINIGAEMDLPISRLVSVIDAVRYRCDVYSMSGKCKHWDPLLPTIFLFAAPKDQFTADQATPSEPQTAATDTPVPPDETAEAEAADTDDGADAGIEDGASEDGNRADPAKNDAGGQEEEGAPSDGNAKLKPTSKDDSPNTKGEAL